MKDITWGQYHSVDSMIHRLDPRVKIRFTIVYIILLLLDRNLPLFVFLTTVFAGVWVCSRVPMRKMIRGTRGIFLFILICSALNAFTVHGTTLVKLGVLTITKEGLMKAGFVFWRMLLVDSDVKPADVYDDTDATHGWYGEVYAFKRRCGNGNHDRAPVCTDIIWRVRPDHESADGAWCGL